MPRDQAEDDSPRPRWPVAAILLGCFSTFITAGMVSWATPDGNLVVTLVPALVVGMVAFGLAMRRWRRGGAK